MRINAITQAFQNKVRKVESTRKNESNIKFKALGTDKPTISDDAKQMSKSQAPTETIAAQVRNQPDIRMDRVEEVKKRVEQGYYNTPEFIDKLSEKLIQDFGFSEPKM